jgi:hypothetical protein
LAPTNSADPRLGPENVTDASETDTGFYQMSLGFELLGILGGGILRVL